MNSTDHIEECLRGFDEKFPSLMSGGISPDDVTSEVRNSFIEALIQERLRTLEDAEALAKETWPETYNPRRDEFIRNLKPKDV